MSLLCSSCIPSLLSLTPTHFNVFSNPLTLTLSLAHSHQTHAYIHTYIYTNISPLSRSLITHLLSQTRTHTHTHTHPNTHTPTHIHIHIHTHTHALTHFIPILHTITHLLFTGSCGCPLKNQQVAYGTCEGVISDNGQCAATAGSTEVLPCFPGSTRYVQLRAVSVK